MFGTLEFTGITVAVLLGLLLGYLLFEWGYDLRLAHAKRENKALRRTVAIEQANSKRQLFELEAAKECLRRYRKQEDDALFLLVHELGATEIRSTSAPH